MFSDEKNEDNADDSDDGADGAKEGVDGQEKEGEGNEEDNKSTQSVGSDILLTENSVRDEEESLDDIFDKIGQLPGSGGFGVWGQKDESRQQLLAEISKVEKKSYL